MWAVWTLIGSPAASRTRFRTKMGVWSGSRSASETLASASMTDCPRMRDVAARSWRRHDGLPQDAGCGGQVMAAHLLGEAGQLARAFVELAPRHKRAAPLLPADVSQLRQFVQRLPDRYLTDSKALSDLGLVRKLFIGPPPARFDLSFQDGLKLMIEWCGQLFIERAEH